MTSGDVQCRCHGGLLQHGPFSDRVYIMDIDPTRAAGLIAEVESLISSHGYSKIFAKVPAGMESLFRDHGLHVEARVPRMFNGTEDGLFMSRFLDRRRSRPRDPELLQQVLGAATAKAGRGTPVSLPDGWRMRPAGESDWEDLARLYGQVFASYPFPINDADYLRETAASHVDYYLVENAATIAAAASTERDRHGGAEMTDFATRPELRGKGMAGALLSGMEPGAARKGVFTAYTIARGVSFGMNVTFARGGYSFGGALINNTQISGRLETMNVWHKPLQRG